MDIRPPNPTKLLEHWMEWEKGEITPGDLMKQFKIGGMREVLEALVAGEAPLAPSGETVGDILGS